MFQIISMLIDVSFFSVSHLFRHSRSICHLEPRAKGLEVNELWLGALVSNESWQWQLNGVTHTHIQPVQWAVRGQGNTTRDGGRGPVFLQDLWPTDMFHKQHKNKCLSCLKFIKLCLISLGLSLSHQRCVVQFSQYWSETEPVSHER